MLAVQSQVIRFERDFLRERAGRIDSPETDLVIGSIIEGFIAKLEMELRPWLICESEGEAVSQRGRKPWR